MGAGFLSDEHKRITIRGDNDLICGSYQKAGCNEIMKGKAFTIEDEYKVVCVLSNSSTFDALE